MIGGVLGLRELDALYNGKDANSPRVFRLLTGERQVEAVRKMLSTGMSEQEVATATAWSVEQVRRVAGGRTA